MPDWNRSHPNGLASWRPFVCFAICVVAVGIAGCGGTSQPSAPASSELEQFLSENPEIAEGSGTMGGE